MFKVQCNRSEVWRCRKVWGRPISSGRVVTDAQYWVSLPSLHHVGRSVQTVYKKQANDSSIAHRTPAQDDNKLPDTETLKSYKTGWRDGDQRNYSKYSKIILLFRYGDGCVRCSWSSRWDWRRRSTRWRLMMVTFSHCTGNSVLCIGTPLATMCEGPNHILGLWPMEGALAPQRKRFLLKTQFPPRYPLSSFNTGCWEPLLTGA